MELLIVARPMMYTIIHNIKYFLPSMLNHVFNCASQLPRPTVVPWHASATSTVYTNYIDRQSQTSVSMIYGIVLGLKEEMKGSFVPVH